jgi:hypothetical protein
MNTKAKEKPGCLQVAVILIVGFSMFLFVMFLAIAYFAPPAPSSTSSSTSSSTPREYTQADLVAGGNMVNEATRNYGYVMSHSTDPNEITAAATVLKFTSAAYKDMLEEYKRQHPNN